MISFNEIPNTLRVPFVAAEFDASQASQGPALLDYRGLLIAQKLAAGSAADNSLHDVTSVEQVIDLGGRGSLAHRMMAAWRARNTFTRLTMGFLADDAGGTAATGTITATGPATADGEIPLYLGGERVPVAVNDADTGDDIATAIAAAINENLDLPVTAVVDGVTTNQVNVTHRHKGTVGNGYDLRDSYLPGEKLPAGVALAYGPMATGATDPDLATLIAALGDTWYHIWAHPYANAATQLAAIEAELASRFGPLRMIDGVAFGSAVGAHATLTTLGNGRNSQHSSIMAQPGINPLTPASEFAAELGAVVARFGNIDPARPFQTLPLSHAIPPAEGDLFTIEERNLLLFDGIGTTRAGAGGVVQVERPITTYQTNAAGAADTAYLDVNTLLTLQYLRYSYRVRMQTKYPRHKLADDGTRFGPGQAVMTPKLGKAETLGWYREMESLGLVEKFDVFKQNLQVVRSQIDPNRLDVLLPPDLINQLIVTAAQFQFRL